MAKSAKPAKRNGLFIIVGVVALAVVAVAIVVWRNQAANESDRLAQAVAVLFRFGQLGFQLA